MFFHYAGEFTVRLFSLLLLSVSSTHFPNKSPTVSSIGCTNATDSTLKAKFLDLLHCQKARSPRPSQDFPKGSQTTKQSAASEHANIIPQGSPACFAPSYHTRGSPGPHALLAPKTQSWLQTQESSLGKVLITH